MICVGRIFGKVLDEENKPLPFATLHLKNTSLGTTTNIDGAYSIDLAAGNYILIFQYVGYKAESIKIVVNTGSKELNVVLHPEVFQLREVIVKAGDENPAYEIIRNAIKNRQKHLTEVDA